MGAYSGKHLASYQVFAVWASIVVIAKIAVTRLRSVMRSLAELPEQFAKLVPATCYRLICKPDLGDAASASEWSLPVTR